MKAPAVSILLPVHNNVTELPRAMAGLRAQTMRDFEIVAVDDGSTDGSGGLLDRYAREDPRLRVIHQPNAGLGPSLARACREARGALLARQDADDVSAPTRLERQTAYLDRHPDAVVCSTWAGYVDPARGPSLAYEVPDDPRLLRKLLEGGSNPLTHGAAVIRRSAYEREGVGYRFRGPAQDFDLWLRLSALGELGIVESVEYLYWLSTGGISYGNPDLGSRLVALAMRLHRERRTLGREVTPWREAEEALRREADGDTRAPDRRETLAAYAAGLRRLNAGEWTDYVRAMRDAAGGRGPVAAKARRHLRMAWAAPLIRGLYALRRRRTMERHLRALPPGTPFPVWVREGNESP
jgi:glycosyltransferase involved in cell wall biosynthesis